MPISFEASGSFAKTEQFLKKLQTGQIFNILNKYGAVGVAALAAATPTDTGQTAASWGYKITNSGKDHSIAWTNSHVVAGARIALLIQYGHGTGTGGYIQGRDYINPAIRPVFEQMLADIRRELSR